MISLVIGRGIAATVETSLRPVTAIISRFGDARSASWITFCLPTCVAQCLDS